MGKLFSSTRKLSLFFHSSRDVNGGPKDSGHALDKWHMLYKVWGSLKALLNEKLATLVGSKQRVVIYTEHKPLDRLYNMCYPFFHEFRVIPSANGFHLVCYTASLFITEAVC